MSWLTKLLPPRIKSTPGVRKTPVPEGLWIKCVSCETVLYRTDPETNLMVFPNRVPYVCIAASGGARMQEGVNSLFQMAKTTAVLQELTKARLPFVSILTDPTMGGVSASFAFVADLVLAEPGALIGFAGPRVIEQTVREKLPEGFQRAEFLVEKGALDMIVDRRQLRDELARLLTMLTRQPTPSA